MELNLQDRLFIVTGATSGFGKSVTEELIANSAKVIIVARTADKLNAIVKNYKGQVEGIRGDITKDEVHEKLIRQVGSRKLDGIFVNAGGPPAMTFLESDIESWDNAYSNVLRWKIKLVKALLPQLIDNNYGRIVFLESSSVKQPVPNLVLSNSLRMAVVGAARTLSDEVAQHGITVNVICPGYHNTDALKRLFVKRSEVMNISLEEAQKDFENDTKVGKLGDPKELAKLAIWLLSPHSSYITGQSITVDGGTNRGIY